MSLVQRLFGKREAVEQPRALYDAVVRAARQPDWYRDGAVPDTLDGRFEMVAAVLTVALLRLEAEGDPGREPAARLAELFIADMDGQLRQSGIGDLVVGKHIGKMMSALGGRLGAYRVGLADGDLDEALRRNVYRGAEVPAEAVAITAARLRALAARLADMPVASVLAGDFA